MEVVVMGELMVDGDEAITGRVTFKQVERKYNYLVRWSNKLDTITHGGSTSHPSSRGSLSAHGHVNNDSSVAKMAFLHWPRPVTLSL